MTRIETPRRRRKPSKRLDLTDLRAALRDRRCWTALGVVIGDAGPHYELVREGGEIVDVFVEVELAPGGEDLTCRLATCAGGPGAGLWRVPPVGAEVAVLIPAGRLDFMPTIVGVLSTGAAPERVATDRTVLVAGDRIEVTAPTVILGPDPDAAILPRDGFVHGTGIDTLTGLPYWQLGSASMKVGGSK